MNTPRLKEVRIAVSAQCPECGGRGVTLEEGECLGCVGQGRAVFELSPEQLAQLLAQAVRA